MTRMRAKDIDIIEMSEHRLQIRLWGRVYLLQLDSEAYKTEFLRLLRLLDGRCEIEAIVPQIQLPADEVRTIIDTLRDMSLIESAEADSGAVAAVPAEYLRRHAGVFRVFDSSKTKRRAECERRAYGQQIALVGSGPLCEALERTLPEFGLSRLRRASFADTRVLGSDAQEIVVAVLDTPRERAALDALNRACVELGRTLVPIALEDGRAQIGPAVVPGKTACVQCRALRSVSNIENLEAYDAYRKFVDEHDRTASDPPAHQLAVAVFATHELLRISTGYAQARSYNGVLELDVWNSDLKRTRVLKFPSCTVCSARARRPKYDTHAFAGMLARL